MTAEEKVLNRLRVVLIERMQRIEKAMRRAVREKRYNSASALSSECVGVQWAIADLDDQKQECRSGLVLK